MRISNRLGSSAMRLALLAPACGGDISPPAGATGAWTIKVTLQNYSGTVNFAVQMQ